MTDEITENGFNADYVERNETEFDFANRSNRDANINTFRAADADSDETYTLAGRIVRLNDLGSVIFADVRDGSGTVQFAFFGEQESEYDESQLVVGDYIEATGAPTETNTGEFSLDVQEWEILTPVSRDIPMRTGLNEQQQATDRVGAMITNDELRESVQTRFEVINSTREWLTQRGFQEVQTPMLHHTASGAAATPFETYSEALDENLRLRIAPELYLKRLVMSGFEQIFEIGRNFRNEDADTTHNPEFTMLELYSAYADYEEMMDLTEDLVTSIVRQVNGEPTVEFNGHELDFSGCWERLDYFELLEEHVGEDVRELDNSDLLERTEDMTGEPVSSRSEAYEELYDHLVEPELVGPCFVVDHPRSSTPLCAVHPDDEERVERFEVVVAGVELANAYTELTDPQEQERAFNAQNGDGESYAGDQQFVEDLGYGMPPTGGLGIGLDRLAMVVTGTNSIRQVLPFPLTQQNGN